MRKNKFYYCDDCNKKLNKKRDHIQEPDPYMKEVYDEIFITDLCEKCYEENCYDI